MKNMDKIRDIGLLILRIGIGVIFLHHGWPKISGGPENWGKIGMSMGNLGIHFLPVFWGFMASISEFGGGVCLVLGLFLRPAVAFMAFTMFVAAKFHFGKHQGFEVASHAIELCILFSSLIFIGAGRYSLDELIFHRKKQSTP